MMSVSCVQSKMKEECHENVPNATDTYWEVKPGIAKAVRESYKTQSKTKATQRLRMSVKAKSSANVLPVVLTYSTMRMRMNAQNVYAIKKLIYVKHALYQ